MQSSLRNTLINTENTKRKLVKDRKAIEIQAKIKVFRSDQMRLANERSVKRISCTILRSLSPLKHLSIPLEVTPLFRN